MRPADGLIGMWVHSFDANGDVDRQFQILRRTGDGYVCQLYSMEDGYRSELKVISRKEIISKMTIYSSHFEMNDALDRIEEEQRAKKELKWAAMFYLKSMAAKHQLPKPDREASLTLN